MTLTNGIRLAPSHTPPIFKVTLFTTLNTHSIIENMNYLPNPQTQHPPQATCATTYSEASSARHLTSREKPDPSVPPIKSLKSSHLTQPHKTRILQRKRKKRLSDIPLYRIASVVKKLDTNRARGVWGIGWAKVWGKVGGILYYTVLLYCIVLSVYSSIHTYARHDKTCKTRQDM
jgi:hypothetical protein